MAEHLICECVVVTRRRREVVTLVEVKMAAANDMGQYHVQVSKASQYFDYGSSRLYCIVYNNKTERVLINI